MPQAIPLIAGYIATGYVAAAGAYAWVAAVAGGVVAFGTTKLLGLDKPPKVEDPGAQINTRGTVEPIPILYGRNRVGGALATIFATPSQSIQVRPSRIPGGDDTYVVSGNETDNKYLNMVICWGEGEVSIIERLYFDERIDEDPLFDDHVFIEHHTGADDQVASPGLVAEVARVFTPDYRDRMWSSNHRLAGVAYTYLRLTYDQYTWFGGMPIVTASVKGRRILDVRTDVTAYSTNPALILYDYLTNTRFGRGIDPDEIDTESFQDAANYCDQEVTTLLTPASGESGSVSLVQARYDCNLVLNPDSTHIENVNHILATCRGVLVFSGGKYKLKLDKIEVPTFDLTEDHIVGDWAIQPESSDSRLNKIQVQWRNLTNRYQPDLATVSSETFLANDDGVVLEEKVELSGVTQIYRATQLAGMILRQSRYSVRCEVRATIAALQCEVYDVITVTSSVAGWDQKLFRVMAIAIENQDEVRLQLQEYADDVYDLDSQNEEDSGPATNLPDPRIVQMPAPDSINLYWLADPPDYIPYARLFIGWQVNEPLAIRYIISHRWRPFEASDWSMWTEITLDQPEVQTIVPDATGPPTFDGIGAWVNLFLPRGQVQYRVRAMNSLGIVSPWSDTDLVNVAGDPTVPTTPTALRVTGHPSGIQLRWQHNDTRPYVRYQIWRVLSGEGFAFSGATLVATVAANNYVDTLTPGTVAGYWVRPVTVYGVTGTAVPNEVSDFPETNTAGLTTYASDAAAGSAGLTAGDLYTDGSGNVKVKT